MHEIHITYSNKLNWNQYKHFYYFLVLPHRSVWKSEAVLLGSSSPQLTFGTFVVSRISWLRCVPTASPPWPCEPRPATPDSPGSAKHGTTAFREHSAGTGGGSTPTCWIELWKVKDSANLGSVSQHLKVCLGQELVIEHSCRQGDRDRKRHGEDEHRADYCWV